MSKPLSPETQARLAPLVVEVLAQTVPYPVYCLNKADDFVDLFANEAAMDELLTDLQQHNDDDWVIIDEWITFDFTTGETDVNVVSPEIESVKRTADEFKKVPSWQFYSQLGVGHHCLVVAIEEEENSVFFNHLYVGPKEGESREDSFVLLAAQQPLDGITSTEVDDENVLEYIKPTEVFSQLIAYAMALLTLGKLESLGEQDAMTVLDTTFPTEDCDEEDDADYRRMAQEVLDFLKNNSGQ